MKITINDSNENSMNWVWKVKGKGVIELKRWERQFEPDRHCWNLYILLFKGTPLYNRAMDLGVEDDAFDTGDEIIPDFHGGCTYVKVEPNKGVIKLGCDFLHLCDDCFENTDDPKNLMVFVNRLYKHLEEQS